MSSIPDGDREDGVKIAHDETLKVMNIRFKKNSALKAVPVGIGTITEEKTHS